LAIILIKINFCLAAPVCATGLKHLQISLLNGQDADRFAGQTTSLEPWISLKFQQRIVVYIVNLNERLSTIFIKHPLLRTRPLFKYDLE